MTNVKSIEIPVARTTLVFLIGMAGSGKSTFARSHFKESEIVSSDHYRYILSDDAEDQRATSDVFKLMHIIVDKRLKRKLVVVVDATNLNAKHRKPLIDLAKKHNAQTISISLNLSYKICVERNGHRKRHVPLDVLKRQSKAATSCQKELYSEMDKVVLLNSEVEIANVIVLR